MQAADVLSRLKEETAHHHREVEAQVTFLEAPDPRGAYAGYLARLLGFHAPLERALAALPLPGALRGREKAPLLSADLRALGVSPEAVPACEALPDLSTLPRALGCCYVLEGATLGGKYVRRRLAGRVPDEATGYLNCYGEEVGPRWNAFRTAVRESLAPADHEACIDAARDTFDALGRWLQREGPTKP